LRPSAFFAAEYLVPAIREFSTLHPAVEFDLRISETFTDSVALRRRRHDPHWTAGPPLPLQGREKISRPFVASSSRLLPMWCNTVDRRNPRPNSHTHACHRAFLGAGTRRPGTFHGPDGTSERVAITGKVTTDNSYVVKHAVLSGLGIAVAPFFHFREGGGGGTRGDAAGRLHASPDPRARGLASESSVTGTRFAASSTCWRRGSRRR